MRSLTIKDFLYGTIDTLEDISIPRGASSKSLNWQTKIDKIELVRGYSVLGDESATVKKITGLYVARTHDGTEIAFRTYGKKLEHLNTTTDLWVETGTDVLGAAADGQDISFTEYHSLAGDALYVNSPYGPYIKIMLANPGSYTDLYNSAKNHKGYILIKQNRTFLWGRLKDKTGVYGSFIDTENYTEVNNEVLDTGDGTTKTFTGTLVFKAAGAKRTCFAIEITDGVETFTDNYDGTLTGDAGGTGTINYTSGAISVTFNTAVANLTDITVNYQWVDDTDEGIADFDYSATRLAGEGFIFRQDDGGGATQSILSYGDKEYCMHEKKTWELELTRDDTNANNLIYREKVGIPYWRAAVPTADGVYYIDDSDQNDPQIRLLTIPYGMDRVIPTPISKQIIYKKKRVGIDLSNYEFDKAVGIEWTDYIIFACRTSTVSENNQLIVYDKKQKTIDILERYASGLAIYNGTLIAADPFVKNVYTLFSGWDDDESLIINYWEGNKDDLGFTGLKKVKKMLLIGQIAKEQSLEISASVDNGPFVLIGTAEGNGDYVDAGQEVSVGRNTVGEKEVGGGGEATAYNYEYEFKPGLDKFETIKLRLEAIGLGYVSVGEIRYEDLRLKSQKIAKRYRS